jgi:hypothetical protein
VFGPKKTTKICKRIPSYEITVELGLSIIRYSSANYSTATLGIVCGPHSLYAFEVLCLDTETSYIQQIVVFITNSFKCKNAIL